MATLTQAVRTTASGPETKRASRTRNTGSRTGSSYYWMVWPAVIAFAAFHTVPMIVLVVRVI